jgi:hypothetical protein
MTPGELSAWNAFLWCPFLSQASLLIVRMTSDYANVTADYFQSVKPYAGAAQSALP